MAARSTLSQFQGSGTTGWLSSYAPNKKDNVELREDRVGVLSTKCGSLGDDAPQTP